MYFHSKVDKHTESIFSLFDSSSPRSFVSNAHKPPSFVKSLEPTKYYGVGINRNKLMSYGTIKCIITYKKKIILPSASMVTPMLVGRDLLPKLNVHLCKLKFKYSRGIA